MGLCLGYLAHNSDPSSSIGASTEGSFINHKNGFLGGSKSGRSFRDSGSLEGSSRKGEILQTPNLKVFTFAELKLAAKNFKSETLLGEGGFGKVYKGWIDLKTLSPSDESDNEHAVAIKKLNPERDQGFEEWQSEVNFLGRLSHPNIVRLLGYCWENKDLLLVYEFMSKGSVENHLFRRNPSSRLLTWEIRLKVAMGAAQGLAFLHTSEKQVIYRDFKASNILLDADYNAKISDFGLAKFGPSIGNSHVTTKIMGTFGYAAPEYLSTGRLYVKSDVYGFGVVLLELLTGMRAFDSKRVGENHNLVQWAKPILKKSKLSTIMDARINGQYSKKASFLAGELALKCLELEPDNRPSMKQVIRALERIKAIELK